MTTVVIFLASGRTLAEIVEDELEASQTVIDIESYIKEGTIFWLGDTLVNPANVEAVYATSQDNPHYRNKNRVEVRAINYLIDRSFKGEDVPELQNYIDSSDTSMTSNEGGSTDGNGF